MLCRTLQGHGHWVNILALSTDYVMRTGAYDPRNADIVRKDQSVSGKKFLYLKFSHDCNNGALPCCQEVDIPSPSEVPYLPYILL